MRRSSFLKALAVVPFAPRMLEGWAPSGPLAEMDTEVREDGSWVVEFAGATFYLDAPSMLSVGNSKNAYRPTYSATAPFECRMGVDGLDNGWKRLWVARDGLTYSCTVRRGPADMDWVNLGAEVDGGMEWDNLAIRGHPQGVIGMFTPRRIR